MSEEDKAPKKAARKRVVKKGVRGPRAPRKKTVVKNTDESAPAEEASPEEISQSTDESSAPEESASASEPVAEIQVVEETPAKPEDEKSKKGAKKKGKSKDENSSSDDDSGESAEEDEQGQSRNRRGRNRRGGNARDRDDSGGKRPAIDKEEAAAKAWEIYQGELEEEGVSLVDPRRAREVARRCLELATIFCEERDRYLER